MKPASLGRPLQGAAGYPDQLGSGQGDNVGAAFRFLLPDHRHLAKTVAGCQEVEDHAVLEHLQFAIGKKVEEIAHVAVANEHRAWRNPFPLGETDDLPYLDIGEFGKKGKRPQRVELLEVGHAIGRHAQLPVTKGLCQIVCEFRPVAVAVLQSLAHRARDDRVEYLRNFAAQ